MFKASYTASQLAKELQSATWDILEAHLRSEYQTQADRLIKEAVDGTMQAIKCHVESVHKPHNGEVIFNVHINGVKQEVTK